MERLITGQIGVCEVLSHEATSIMFSPRLRSTVEEGIKECIRAGGEEGEL